MKYALAIIILFAAACRTPAKERPVMVCQYTSDMQMLCMDFYQDELQDVHSQRTSL